MQNKKAPFSRELPFVSKLYYYQSNKSNEYVLTATLPVRVIGITGKACGMTDLIKNENLFDFFIY